MEVLQPPEPPAFDQALVGKRLEVCWPYKEEGKTVKIWASGTVRRVADGLTDKRSARAKVVLPAGMVLWAWDADPEFGESAGEKRLASGGGADSPCTARQCIRELCQTRSARIRPQTERRALCLQG
mgnify:CR=1 FL=1